MTAGLTVEEPQLAVHAAEPDIDWRKSPTPGSTVDVHVRIYVKAIHGIDAKRGTASVGLMLTYYWMDDRAGKARREDSDFELPKELWKPGLELANGIDESQERTTDFRRGRLC